MAKTTATTAPTNGNLPEAFRDQGIMPPPNDEGDWRIWAANVLLRVLKQLNNIQSNGCAKWEEREAERTYSDHLWDTLRGYAKLSLSAIGTAAGLTVAIYHLLLIARMAR